jgi:hypothetical protein
MHDVLHIRDPDNLILNARDSDTRADLSDGARYARIQAAIPQGCSALTSLLFFDEIQRDQKGYATGEGIIIVGGFFSKDARESSYAKLSLDTLPKTGFAKVDLGRVAVKKFTKALRASQHAAIADCYRQYNAKGGRVLTLQSGNQVYLSKAVVLAVYADFPATQKITLTGSAAQSVTQQKIKWVTGNPLTMRLATEM